MRLKYNMGFQAKMHYKYVPLESKDKYIPYDFNGRDIILKAPNTIDIDNFKKKSLNEIKNKVDLYNPTGSEKRIQSNFITETDGFIDSEFQFEYNYNGENKKGRIDLIWIDKKSKKILFIELKTIGNKDLYDQSIKEQLKTYNEFLNHNKHNILKYYMKLFKIKQNLGILPDELIKIGIHNNYSIEEKPLLLIGDCNNSWINNNKDEINQKINNIALGAYYFGSPNDCNINKSSKSRYRCIF